MKLHSTSYVLLTCYEQGWVSWYFVVAEMFHIADTFIHVKDYYYIVMTNLIISIKSLL